MLVDSHCHLGKDADLVLARARDAGVLGFLCVGVGKDASNAERAVALAQAHADVFGVVGLHPHEAGAASEDLYGSIEALARRDRVVAVGEIGLDYHYDYSPRDQQREVFRAMIRMALRIGKPIVIHTREAPDDTLLLMTEERARDAGGVFHCFSEDVAFARRALDLGFDISLSGIVTFPKADVLQEVARFVPADRFYVETDSPYLAPVPFRGKKCEPAYVVHTARRIAELRGVSFEELCAQTTANVMRRFGIASFRQGAQAAAP